MNKKGEREFAIRKINEYDYLFNCCEKWMNYCIHEYQEFTFFGRLTIPLSRVDVEGKKKTIGFRTINEAIKWIKFTYGTKCIITICR